MNGTRIESLTTDQGNFTADLYLVAVGFEPNIRLAREAGIKLGNDGAIVTDQRQMTSVDGIYAAGDCSEVLNLTTRKTQMMPFATIASKTGRVAGENAAGGAAVFRGAVPVSVLNIFGYEIAQAGSDLVSLQRHGFRTVHEHITAKTLPEFFADSEPTLVTMTAESRSRRILNANIIADKHAALRMNPVSLAIRRQLTVEEFLESDFVYTPRIAPMRDPLLICAQQLQKKLPD
jgi:NADPH-dependent 2,4-dienoyl-CoA reductase/sulfur reductase-like enzyme